MTAPSVEKPAWPWQRWILAIVLVLVVQVGAIVAFGERDFPPPHPRPPIITVALRTAPTGIWSALNDPTLFALPHREGFSGHAWVREPPNLPVHTEWSAELHPLELSTQYLGSVLGEFVRTNAFEPADWVAAPPSSLVWPEIAPAAPVIVASTLMLDGALAERSLVNPLALPIWTNTVTLTNSIVRVAVDAQGHPVTMLLVRPGSGSDAADARALELAKSARFGPPRAEGSEPTSVDGLSFGRMIFQWYTVAGTNTSAKP